MWVVWAEGRRTWRKSSRLWCGFGEVTNNPHPLVCFVMSTMTISVGGFPDTPPLAFSPSLVSLCYRLFLHIVPLCDTGSRLFISCCDSVLGSSPTYLAISWA